MAPPVQLARSILGTFRITPIRSAVWRQRCLYHSYDYSQPPPFPAAESAILSSAISHVPSHGFTVDALKLGARNAGYLDVSTNLFPRGVFDLVNYYLVMQRLALKDSVQFLAEGDQSTGKKLGIGAKVRTLAWARLHANEPIIHRWQEVSCKAKLCYYSTLTHNLRPLRSWRNLATSLPLSLNWQNLQMKFGFLLAIQASILAGIQSGPACRPYIPRRKSS